MTAPQKFVASVDGSRIPALDGIRGLAIFGVLAFHYSWAGPSDTFVGTVLRSASAVGWAGVDLFFVLSGFLITRQLLATRFAPSYYKPFYIRRALRIVPLYVFYLAALVLVIGPVLARFIPERAAELATVKANGLWYVSYTMNILFALQGWQALPLWTTHLWSLAIEEQFYLIWPWFLRRVPIVRVYVLAGVLFAGSTVARLIVLRTARDPALAMYVLTPTRLDGLALGALVAALFLTDRGRELTRRFAKVAALISIIVLVTLAATHPAMSILDVRVELIGFPAFAVAGASLIALSISRPQESRLNRVLSFRPLRQLGFYSYGIYVLHFPTFWLIERVAIDSAPIRSLRDSVSGDILMFSVEVAASIAVAMGSWFLLERNFLKLKRFFVVDSSQSERSEETVSVAVAN